MNYPTYPTCEHGSSDGRNALRVWREAIDAWRAAVAVWVAGIPESKPVIWTDRPGAIRALTRNIGDKPWRVTMFCHSRGGGAFMPWGHEEYKTRADALIEVARTPESFIEHFPGRVLTEEEIKHGPIV